MTDKKQKEIWERKTVGKVMLVKKEFKTLKKEAQEGSY